MVVPTGFEPAMTSLKDWWLNRFANSTMTTLKIFKPDFPGPRTIELMLSCFVITSYSMFEGRLYCVYKIIYCFHFLFF